jgi:hypothetical protein
VAAGGESGPAGRLGVGGAGLQTETPISVLSLGIGHRRLVDRRLPDSGGPDHATTALGDIDHLVVCHSADHWIVGDTGRQWDTTFR